MAKATKTTERVEKVIHEDKDVVIVTMSPEEAHAVHSALWLIETEKTEDPGFLAMKGVQDAIGAALDFPVTTFRFDKSSRFNSNISVCIYSRD